MEDYTFDLKPTDDKALHDQNNMCIYKPIAAWEAGCSSFFCQVLVFFRAKSFQMLIETSTNSLMLQYFKTYCY